ncbi:MAG: hypothetical protein FWG11_01820 [Promicromonosporaceae bacterium]|nr:hypothetical protein [Promicromonosporaceae bacterium]
MLLAALGLLVAGMAVVLIGLLNPLDGPGGSGRSAEAEERCGRRCQERAFQAAKDEAGCLAGTGGFSMWSDEMNLRCAVYLTDENAHYDVEWYRVGVTDMNTDRTHYQFTTIAWPAVLPAEGLPAADPEPEGAERIEFGPVSFELPAGVSDSHPRALEVLEEARQHAEEFAILIEEFAFLAPAVQAWANDDLLIWAEWFDASPDHQLPLTTEELEAQRPGICVDIDISHGGVEFFCFSWDDSRHTWVWMHGPYLLYVHIQAEGRSVREEAGELIDTIIVRR